MKGAPKIDVERARSASHGDLSAAAMSTPGVDRLPCPRRRPECHMVRFGTSILTLGHSL